MRSPRRGRVESIGSATMKGPGMIFHRSSTRSARLLAILASSVALALRRSICGRTRVPARPGRRASGSDAQVKLASFASGRGPQPRAGASAGSTAGRSASPSCAARSSCSTSGRSAASTATTSCPTWRSSKRSTRTSWSSSASIRPSSPPSSDTENIRRKVREYRIKHPVDQRRQPGHLEPLRRPELADPRPASTPTAQYVGSVSRRGPLRPVSTGDRQARREAQGAGAI